MLFKKKEPRVLIIDGKKIELQPKKKRFSLFGKGTAAGRPKQPTQPQPQPQPQPAIQSPIPSQTPPSQPPPRQPAQQAPPPQTQQRSAPAPPKPGQQSPGAWRKHILKIEMKNRKLEALLKQHGIKQSVFEFIQRMLIASIIIAVVIAATMLLLLVHLNLNPIIAVVLALGIGFAVYQYAFASFLRFPLRKEARTSKNIERDILFASRDLIISLRSGMPLYNAIASVSTGYGDASREFAKITERAQLGMSLEEAIDQTIEESKSASFRRLMLQASVSIKAGADVIGSLQSIIDQLSEERVIALRRYGQRLNAIAMFYMLFGVILPSMGIAIGTILTTFISVFTINFTLLEVALVALLFLQIIFLQMIRSSRPVFSM